MRDAGTLAVPSERWQTLWLEVDYFRAAASFTETGTANPSSVR